MLLHSLSASADTFNTVSFDMHEPYNINPIMEVNREEMGTYAMADSLRGITIIPVEVGATMPDSLVTDGEADRVRSIASRQVVYYESLVDSLLYENFMLRIELAVAKRQSDRVSYLATEPSDTGISGTYAPADDLTIESLIAEIIRNGIKHPRVVLAQAILETGWFRSRVCHTHNNLFGLRQPWDGEYFRFERWQDSVKAYRTKVQYKYKGGPYLQWLKTLGYAEDPHYTDKLRVLLSGPLKDL